MSCRCSGGKSIRVKANDLKRLLNAGVFVKHGVFGRFRFEYFKGKMCPAERQFNVVTQEVTFEKFECNYPCTINSMKCFHGRKR